MTTTVDLVPGLVTTRDEIAAAYGCGTFQGIEPAVEAGKVFVYSDPSAGEEYGYTFDGRAEDDEFGPLYLYTGAGANGDQKPSGRNGSLLTAAEKGREIHLFVAHGKVPGSGTMRQRYIGEMVLDPIKPYYVRRGPGKDGVMRDVLVFRFRPAPGTTPAWTEADRLPAAPASDYEITEPAVDVPEPVSLPTQSGAKVKDTEQYSTAETTADIPASQRKVLRREGELVKAFVAHLTAAGHKTHSFQITVKGEPGALTPDLYDATDHALYEAKGQTTRTNVRMAIGQLADYRRHIPNRDGLRVAVLLPSEPTADVKDFLTAEGVALVYRTDDGFAGWPLASTAP
jgi:5-methylcytosine-specific restriction protein A